MACPNVTRKHSLQRIKAKTQSTFIGYFIPSGQGFKSVNLNYYLNPYSSVFFQDSHLIKMAFYLLFPRDDPRGVDTRFLRKGLILLAVYLSSAFL